MNNECIGQCYEVKNKQESCRYPFDGFQCKSKHYALSEVFITNTNETFLTQIESSIKVLTTAKVHSGHTAKDSCKALGNDWQLAAAINDNEFEFIANVVMDQSNMLLGIYIHTPMDPFIKSNQAFCHTISETDNVWFTADAYMYRNESCQTRSCEFTKATIDPILKTFAKLNHDIYCNHAPIESDICTILPNSHPMMPMYLPCNVSLNHMASVCEIHQALYFPKPYSYVAVGITLKM